MPAANAVRPPGTPGAGRHGIVKTMITTWTRADWLQAGVLLGFIAVMHVAAFGVLFGAVGPGHYQLGTKIFGVGLGITAYTYGLRHAFDADHIAAIDNTTRKLRGEGRRPKSVGFWFAMGHSTIVAGMAALVAAGAHIVGTLTSGTSTANQTLGIIGTGVGGSFLYIIAILNLVALIGIVRVFRAMRGGELDEAQLETHLQYRGLMNRILGRLTRTSPGRARCTRSVSCSASVSTPRPRSRSWCWPAPAPPAGCPGTRSWSCPCCSPAA